MLSQVLYSLDGVLHTLLCLEPERLCNYAHGKDAHILGYARYDRSRSGTGTASHTAGNEYHVSTL